MPRRILLLITDLEIGGTPTVVRELANRLNAPPDVIVEVACLSKWGPVADQLKERGVAVHALNARGPLDVFRTTRALVNLVRAGGFDTVFSFLIHANFIAARASLKLPGVRFLQSIQTVQPRPRWHWWVQRWAARRAQRIVAPSYAIVHFAGRRSAIPREKCVVIPNAVEPESFARVPVFQSAKTRAGYLGRLDWAKSPGLLLHDVGFYNDGTIELHYFGEGPARAWLEKRVRSDPLLASRVTFHGRVARPVDALRQMDMLWQPSDIEGFGLVLIEAMASGVPVVTLAAGGAAEVVTNRENGFAIPVSGTRIQGDFCDPIYELRRDPALLSRLIQNGLRTVRERFSWDVVLPQYRKLLDL